MLPKDRPMYLMGMCTPEDRCKACAGADLLTASCTAPRPQRPHFTRFRPHGDQEPRFRNDSRLWTRNAAVIPAGIFFAANLRHLYVPASCWLTGLKSVHNLYYYLSLAAQARTALWKAGSTVSTGVYTSARRESDSNLP